MLGAIIGDIVGSAFEGLPTKSKDFVLFSPACEVTDDSLMTMAVGCACVMADPNEEEDFKQTLTRLMRQIGREYPEVGYGRSFYDWLMSDGRGPYNSYGNGAAMRVSPTAWAAESLEEAERLAKWSAEVTHDHPEGIRGAQAVAAAIYLARTGKSKAEIEEYIQKKYYSLAFTVAEIRPSYRFDVSCQGSVPQAIRCFLEAEDYEDAIRTAVSLGGDADTQAAITGSVAEAYFGIPKALAERGISYLDETQLAYYTEYADILYGADPR